MGFFEKLGRKVGEFTHEAKEAAADEAGYVCEECGNQFYTEQACPECGSERVTPRDTGSDDDPDAESTASDEDAGVEQSTDDTSSATDATDEEASPSTDLDDDAEQERE